MTPPQESDWLNQLKGYRQKIDALDDQILKLLNDRARCAQAVGHLKSEHGEPTVYRPEREAEVLQRVMDQNQGPLRSQVVGRLFREVMSACLALERPLSAAYLGPIGTYSQQATEKHFGHSAETHACSSIDEVFHALETETVDYAVVPVENSTEGSVGRTLDLMVHTSLKICGEVFLPIRHALLSHQSNLAQINTVYVHPQTLGQCQVWLHKYLPHAQTVTVASNAEAARRAAQEPDTAAIAGEQTSNLYQIPIRHFPIQDDPNNITRFWVLGHQSVLPSGRDKTSLVLSAANRPGAVFELLRPLAQHQVSMSRFESRPSKTGTWEYLFFIDLEGHQTDTKVSNALEILKEQSPFLKLLGSYPIALL
ncbi:MAG: prephenate dehydratase [Pseudomonadota bacterium]